MRASLTVVTALGIIYATALVCHGEKASQQQLSPAEIELLNKFADLNDDGQLSEAELAWGARVLEVKDRMLGLTASTVVGAVNGLRWVVWVSATIFSLSTFASIIVHGIQSPIVLLLAVAENMLADAVAPAMIDAGTSCGSAIVPTKVVLVVFCFGTMRASSTDSESRANTRPLLCATLIVAYLLSDLWWAGLVDASSVLGPVVATASTTVYPNFTAAMPSDNEIHWADLDDSGTIDPDEHAFAISVMRLPFIGPVIGSAFIAARWMWWAMATAGILLTISPLLTPVLTPADGLTAPSKLASFSTYVMLSLVASVIAPPAAHRGSKLCLAVVAAQLWIAGDCVMKTPNRPVLLSAVTLSAWLLRSLWWPSLMDTMTDTSESNIALVTAQSHITHGWTDLDNDGTTSTDKQLEAQGVLDNVQSSPVIGPFVGHLWHHWSNVADDLHRDDGEVTRTSFAACMVLIGGFGWRIHNGPIESNAIEESAALQLAKLTFLIGMAALVIEVFFPTFCDYPFVFDPLSTNELVRILGSPALVAAGLLGVKRGLEPDRVTRISSLTEKASTSLLDAVTVGVTEELLFRFTLQPLLMVAIYGIIGVLPVTAVLFEQQGAAYTRITLGLIDSNIAKAANGSLVYIYATHSADMLSTLYHGPGVAGLLLRPVICLCGRSWLYRFGLFGAIVGHIGFEVCTSVLPLMIAHIFTRQNSNKIKSE